MLIQCTKKLLDKLELSSSELVPARSDDGGEEAFYEYPTKVRIIDGTDPEAGEFLEPDRYEIRFDTTTKLKDIFTETTSCLYTYDFGDNWTHIVSLEKVISDGISRSPGLLERQGECPPEDVGGESGFEEYMRVISDEEDPEYESMLQWSEITRERKKSVDEINLYLSW